METRRPTGGTDRHAHIQTIEELLRHATFKVTADTYTQAVTPVKRDAQARIGKADHGGWFHIKGDHAEQ